MELAEDELRNFILVWISAVVSLSYCYAVSRTTTPGAVRLLLILPVISLILLLPLRLTSIHFIINTVFFLSWLSTFKLLLFAAGQGPLSSHPSLSLPHFIALASLPIKSKPHPSPHKPHIHNIPLLSYLIKATLLASLIKIYDYSDRIQPTVLWVIYIFHIYFMLELTLAVIAAIAKPLLGLELEPQFNEPLLSSSLQDFWGKRWNLMAPGVLRPTVYEPVLKILTRLVDRRKAVLAAVFTTFVVSAATHELIFYYMGRAAPTFEVSAFFLLHGACLCGEIAAKRAVGGAWRPPRVVFMAATVAFVVGTGLWLFMPQMLRFKADERAFEEYAAVGAFVRRAVMGPTGI